MSYPAHRFVGEGRAILTSELHVYRIVADMLHALITKRGQEITELVYIYYVLPRAFDSSVVELLFPQQVSMIPPMGVVDNPNIITTM